MRPIHSLEDLRRAKKELAIKKKVSKREFASHIGTLRHDATGYVLKRVVLPLGIGAVAALAIKFIFFDKNQNPAQDIKDQKGETEQVKENVEKNTWLSYFSILLSIIKIYQTAVAQNKAEEAMNDDDGETTVAADHSDPETPSSTATATGEEPVEEEQEEPEPISPKSFVRKYQQQKND